MAEEKTYTLKELKAKLTEKQRKFCHEWIVDFNATRAAKKAGYSEETAYSIGSENLSKPEIEQYIAFIRHNYEEESGVSKMRNLKELAKIAYTSIARLHNTWIERKDFKSLTDDQKSAIESIDTKTVTINFDDQTKEVEYVKIKLFSKTDAIKTINEMMGYKEAEKVDPNLIGAINLIVKSNNLKDKLDNI